MNTTSNQSRLLSAAMAVLCSLALLMAVGQTLDPSRLSVVPHVVELDRVVVTAPVQPTIAAQVPGSTVAD